ncbi:MAG: prepilin-type N-terminal cleavage/methylation domain-containing protein [candidate division Zixibacteria bacterium]
MKISSDNINRGNSQSGLTLIELIITLIVVGISVLVFYQMFVTGSLLITEQYQRRVALERAEGWMEKMKYYQIQMGVVPMSFQRNFEDFIVVPDDEHEAIVAECRISVEYSSERDPNTNIPYYSEVAVIYEWEAFSGREYQIELRTKF